MDRLKEQIDYSTPEELHEYEQMVDLVEELF